MITKLLSFLTTALRAAGCAATLFGLAASARAQVADSVTLPALGCVQRQIAPGEFALYSAPFCQPPAYVGVVTSVDNAKKFSCAAARWQDGQFTVVPHLVRIRSGANAGRCFPVKSNQSTQIKIKPRVFDDPTDYRLTDLLAPGDIVEVLPANTLGGFFGTYRCALLQGASAGEADNVGIWQRTATDSAVFDGNYLTYYNNGTHWLLNGSDVVQDNLIIYPGETFTISRHAAAGGLALLFVGLVPPATARIDVTGPGLTMIANPFPFDTTLAALGLASMPKWQNGNDYSADGVYVWDGQNFVDYEFDGTNWRRGGKQEIADNQRIPVAGGFFVLRHRQVSGVDSVFTTITPGARD